jgi:hypothetical protein
MSRNKETVQRYMDAFTRSDHAAILSCLTDDVEWVIPGMFQVRGKAAFDKEIENDAFVGGPTIEVTRTTEEHEVVVAEGRVRCARKDGGVLGGFKWSSQHRTERGCDGDTEAAFGAGRTSQVALARPTRGRVA